MYVRAGILTSEIGSRYGESPALTFEGETETFRTLDLAANRAGSGLTAIGVSAGSVVGVLAYNSAEVVHVWLGCERAGLVRVTLHSHFEMETHVTLLQEVGATALVFDSRFSDAVDAHRENLAGMALIAIGDNPPDWATSWSEVTAKGSDGELFLDANEADPVFLQPTTGTTGKPKPWIVTHRSWAAIVNQNLHHLDTFSTDLPSVGPNDVMLHVHALQWATGFQLLYPFIVRGARTVLMDDSEFDPEALAQTLVDEGVTALLLPAPMLTPLLDLIEAKGGIDHKLNRLVIFFATPELLVRTSEVLGDVWCHGFGSTEQGAATTRLLSSEVAVNADRLASVGRAASPFFEVAIVDHTGSRLPAGEVGEIVVRSAMSTSSYWDLPERTENAYFAHNWFRPEDVGYLDADGFLYYVDRAGDSISTPHGTVYPHAVEGAVLRHDAVANVGVVGLSNGEIVAAVQLKPGFIDSVELRREIESAGSAGLKPHELPTVLIVEELPTVLGGAKVQRGVLREALEEQRR
ncbi:class I adenylate-forming enzyme family protein [Aeromicrobium sp.]|uniref:class I adenylate-forming enzyme family protein n=1 Tax=Aeromicrobium sp. TaxID=1871063 RepID=UPI002FC96EA0